MRARKAARRSDSRKGDPNRERYDLGESTAALQAGVKARHAPILVSHHIFVSRDHQPVPTPTDTVDPVCVAPTVALDPGLSDMKLDQVAQDFRDTIIRGHPRLIFYGCSEGE